MTKERRCGGSPTQETLGIIRGVGVQSFRPPNQDPPPLQNSSYKLCLMAILGWRLGVTNKHCGWAHAMAACTLSANIPQRSHRLNLTQHPPPPREQWRYVGQHQSGALRP